MNQNSPEVVTGHVYDGIQEYDNPLPGWWTWLFVASFVFSVVYVVYFHMGTPGRTIHDDYDRQAAQIFELRFAELGDLQPDRATLVKYMNDPKWVNVGKVVFKTHCVSCHGAEGEGKVGPNLTDNHWKSVANIEDIARVIGEGAANGAMPAWRNRLSHVNQIVLAAAYVASLRGSNPPNAKAPEGNEIGAWPVGN